MGWLASLFTSRGANIRELRWNPEGMGWTTRRSSLFGKHGACEARLINEFREIVREPLPDPNDPRFKKWNVHDRFPWA